MIEDHKHCIVCGKPVEIGQVRLLAHLRGDNQKAPEELAAVLIS